MVFLFHLNFLNNSLCQGQREILKYSSLEFSFYFAGGSVGRAMELQYKNFEFKSWVGYLVVGLDLNSPILEFVESLTIFMSVEFTMVLYLAITSQV